MTNGGKAPVSGGRGMALLLVTMFVVLGVIWVIAAMLAPH